MSTRSLAMPAVAHKPLVRSDTFARECADVALCIGCALWISIGLFRRSFFQEYMGELEFLSVDSTSAIMMGLVAVRELLLKQADGQQKTLRLRLLVLALIAPFCMSGILSREAYELLVAVLLAMSARNLDLKRLMRYVFVAMALSLAAIILASLADVVPNVMLVQSNRVRFCLGFRYCLVPSNILLAVTLLWCLMREESFGLVDAAAYASMNAVMYYLTRSRLTTCVALAVVLTFLVRSWSSRAKWSWGRGHRATRFALSNVVLICLVLTAIITAAYHVALAVDGDLAANLGHMFGNRVRRGYEGLANIGVRLMGQDVRWVGHGLSSNGVSAANMGSTYNYVDNMYLHVLIEQGVLYAGYIVLGLHLLSRRAVAMNRMGLAIVLAAMAACGLLDDHALLLYYNPLLLLMFNDLKDA